MSSEKEFVENMINEHVYLIGDDLKDVGERIMYMNMYDDCDADRLQSTVNSSIEEVTRALEKLREQQKRILEWRAVIRSVKRESTNQEDLS